MYGSVIVMQGCSGNTAGFRWHLWLKARFYHEWERSLSVGWLLCVSQEALSQLSPIFILPFSKGHTYNRIILQLAHVHNTHYCVCVCVCTEQCVGCLQSVLMIWCRVWADRSCTDHWIKLSLWRLRQWLRVLGSKGAAGYNGRNDQMKRK